MKLYHRTDFWGELIKPRYRLNDATVPKPAIWVQAVLGSSTSPYWGCCRQEGARVIEIKETHLLENNDGEWGLYLVSSSKGRNRKILYNNFVLIPLGPSHSKVQELPQKYGWGYVGTVRSCVARLDLRTLLRQFDSPRDDTYTHFHIGIFMESVMIFRNKKRGKKASSRKVGERVEKADRNSLYGPSGRGYGCNVEY